MIEETENRIPCSYRLRPLSKAQITALAGKLSISHADAVETSVDRMVKDIDDKQSDPLEQARRHITEANECFKLIGKDKS